VSTQITITPPGGEAQEIKTYDRCSTTLSATSRVGSFSLTLSRLDNSLLDAFPVGSDVRIRQGDHFFRGWLLNSTKTVDGAMIKTHLEGMCYTGRAQKIMVTENYENCAISTIVNDLFEKYMSWVSRDGVISCDKEITISFRDEFLFDCMEKLCALSGYEWFIDEPVPEEIPVTEGNGWGELVEFMVYHPPWPAENLYPLETLYPG